ncbi:hypothetical protein D0T60_18865, partial [Bacteroides sp. 224]|nr:hypothetical protein [Bacteroides sp. 224]
MSVDHTKVWAQIGLQFPVNEYSDFLDFYTQYSSYTYDKDLSVDYGASV